MPSVMHIVWRCVITLVTQQQHNLGGPRCADGTLRVQVTRVYGRELICKVCTTLVGPVTLPS